MDRQDDESHKSKKDTIYIFWDLTPYLKYDFSGGDDK